MPEGGQQRRRWHWRQRWCQQHFLRPWMPCLPARAARRQRQAVATALRGSPCQQVGPEVCHCTSPSPRQTTSPSKIQLSCAVLRAGACIFSLKGHGLSLLAANVCGQNAASPRWEGSSPTVPAMQALSLHSRGGVLKASFCQAQGFYAWHHGQQVGKTTVGAQCCSDGLMPLPLALPLLAADAVRP